MKHVECLRPLPAGGLEKLIFDARMRMREKGAFLWGLNTSQNQRHMKTNGISTKNGLVCGYLNGFICRPECPELLRHLTDATKDSEFAARHYAKDGVVLRYRMYCGITSPYLNRGGLQQNFELKGEKITAEERSSHSKEEERSGAAELHKLFPRLIGPPQQRRDKKTMEVFCYSNGYPVGEGSRRRMIAPRLRDEDVIEHQAKNPKEKGTVSHALYHQYMAATTVAEARRCGSRPIDFAFDSTWGYLTVKKLNIDPRSNECEVLDPDILRERVSIADSSCDVVRVRLKEMSLGHVGIAIPRTMLVGLSQKCRRLQEKTDKEFAAEDGPLVAIPLEVFRVLLHWAETGKLLFESKQTKDLYLALKACGAPEAARKVKCVGLKMLRASNSSVARSACRPVARASREPKASENSVVSSKWRRGCRTAVDLGTVLRRLKLQGRLAQSGRHAARPSDRAVQAV